MTQALKLVLLAAYLTTAYGAALPGKSSSTSEQATSTDGSSSGYGHGTSTSSSTGRPTDGPTGGSLKNGVKGPVFDETFPNPSLIKVKDTWYSFATSHNGKNIQMAKSTDFVNWTYINKDALPNANAAKWVATKALDYGSSSSSMMSSSSSMGSYTMSTMSASTSQSTGGPKSKTTGYEKRTVSSSSEEGYPTSSTKSNESTKTKSSEGTKTTNPPQQTQGQGGNNGGYVPKFRKPDVIETPDGKFVMQFTSRHKNSVHRCIGVAKAEQIEGPFVPEAEPFYCEEDLQGGDFDSSFYQEGGKLYMVFNKRSHQIDDDTPDSPTSSTGGTYETSTAEGYPTATFYSKSSQTSSESTRSYGPSTLERRAYPTSETTSASSSKSTDGPSGYSQHSQHTTSSGSSQYPSGTSTGPKGPKQSQGSQQPKYRESALTLISVSTDKENWGMKPDNSTEPVELLQSNPSDRPGVSAPYLTKQNGIYFLTFSTNEYDTAAYDIEYATSKDLKGPYHRASKPLLKQGDAPKLNGPGGASFSRDGKYMVFQNRDKKDASSSSTSSGPEPYSTGSSSTKSGAHSTSTKSGAHSTKTSSSIETYPTATLPYEQKREQSETQSSQQAGPTDVLGPIIDPIRPQPDNSMIRHLWVGEVEYDGETMNVVGMKNNGGSGPSSTQTYGGHGPSSTQTYGGSSSTSTATETATSTSTSATKTKTHSTGEPAPTYA